MSTFQFFLTNHRVGQTFLSVNHYNINEGVCYKSAAKFWLGLQDDYDREEEKIYIHRKKIYQVIPDQCSKKARI